MISILYRVMSSHGENMAGLMVVCLSNSLKVYKM
jgi:hypothetical protein